MKILIAEDKPDIAKLYKSALEARKHRVVITVDGEECLKAYQDVLKQTTESKTDNSSPFDVVILDQKMPRKDGLEVAREILKVNLNQRIIFASAYVREALDAGAKELNRVVEIMQKPFRIAALVNTIEDKEAYRELEKFNVRVRTLKELDPTNKEVRMLLEDLSKIRKPDVWYAIGDVIAA